MNDFPDQIGVAYKIAGPNDSNFEGCLLVRSILPEEEFKVGGAHWGRCYQWGMNRHVFTRDPDATKAALGMTDEEYNYWLPLITF